MLLFQYIVQFSLGAKMLNYISVKYCCFFIYDKLIKYLKIKCGKNRFSECLFNSWKVCHHNQDWQYFLSIYRYSIFKQSNSTYRHISHKRNQYYTGVKYSMEIMIKYLAEYGPLPGGWHILGLRFSQLQNILNFIGSHRKG